MPISVRLVATLVLAAPLLALPTARPTLAAPGAPADSTGRTDSPAGGRTGGYGAVLLPVMFYTPETKVGAGATAILTHRRAGAASGDDRPSTLTPILIATQEKQLVLAMGFGLVGTGNRWAIDGTVGYVDFPTKFWGVGPDEPDEAEENYARRATYAWANWRRRLVGRLRAGIGFDWEIYDVEDVEAGGLFATGAVPGGEAGSIAGAGVVVDWDTRDRSFAPRTGAFHQVVARAYRDALGSDRDFEYGWLDLRVYRGSAERGVLAGQLVATAAGGDAPFRRYAALGGSEILRGHYEGRYLDRVGGALQLEYRSPFRGRIGFVAHGAVGGVAAEIADLRVEELVASGGVGVRWAWDPEERVHLRLDWGIGSTGSGVYVDLGEAF